MKAEKLPNVLQSRFVRGLKKLNANRMKTAELIRTNVQRPYAGVLVPWSMGGPFQQQPWRPCWCVFVLGDPERVPNPPRDGLRAAEPRSVHASLSPAAFSPEVGRS